MTYVSFSRGRKAQRLRLTGHASGSEKVCAAVSGITYSLLGYLENQDVDSSSQIEEGFAAIMAERGPGIDAAFDTAVIGLAQIAKAEPDYLKINIRTIREKRPG